MSNFDELVESIKQELMDLHEELGSCLTNKSARRARKKSSELAKQLKAFRAESVAYDKRQQ